MAKGFLADLRSNRRERRSVQGSLTADQRRIYKCLIAKKKEKIRRLKLRLAGQPKPDDPEVKHESLEDHSVERETAATSLETKCGTDGGLGSAPSGQETLLDPRTKAVVDRKSSVRGMPRRHLPPCEISLPLRILTVPPQPRRVSNFVL